ncbi:unnamed protein product [Pylaiella littoralis]
MLHSTAVTLIASSSAFVAPMAVRSVAPASSSSSLKIQTTGSAYIATLPHAPFSRQIFGTPRLSDGADPIDIKKWLGTEIKHKRVAMPASLGVLVAEEYHTFLLGLDDIGPAVDHFQEISARFPEFRTSFLISIIHRVQRHYQGVRVAQRRDRRGRPQGGLQLGRPRLRPPEHQVQVRGVVHPHADQGAQQRAPNHDQHRWHAGSRAGQSGQPLRLYFGKIFLFLRRKTNLFDGRVRMSFYNSGHG